MLSEEAALSDVEAAWLEFINRFEPLFIRAIRITYRRHVPNLQLLPEDIPDLIQQILVNLSKNNYEPLRQLKFDKDNTLKLYLCAVAANTTLDSLRFNQATRRPLITNSLSEPAYTGESGTSLADKLYSSEANPEEEYLKNELLDKALAVVDQESTEQTRDRNRKIFYAYIDGYSLSEIEKEDYADLTRQGINSFIKRIRKKLEDLYNFAG